MGGQLRMTMDLLRKTMPNLAYLGQVTTIYPIPEADLIESLEVVCGKGGRWRGTAKKAEFAVGELCKSTCKTLCCHKPSATRS